MTASSHNSPADTEKQIQFARHDFDNLQNLIRFTDTKSAALITIAIFLGASGIQVAKDAVAAINFCSLHNLLLGVLFLGGCFGFLLSFGWMVACVENVLRPRGARHYPKTAVGRDLMWQDHVIQHGTSAAYFDAVHAATPELILRNVTDQVFELSHVSNEKMDAFHRARACFRFAFCFWVIITVCGVLLVRW